MIIISFPLCFVDSAQTERKKNEKSQHVEQFHSTKNEKRGGECVPVSTEKRANLFKKTLDEMALEVTPPPPPVNPLKVSVSPYPANTTESMITTKQ